MCNYINNQNIIVIDDIQFSLACSIVANFSPSCIATLNCGCKGRDLDKLDEMKKKNRDENLRSLNENDKIFSNYLNVDGLKCFQLNEYETFVLEIRVLKDGELFELQNYMSKTFKKFSFLFLCDIDEKWHQIYFVVSLFV